MTNDIFADSDRHIGRNFNLNKQLESEKIIEKEKPKALVHVGDTFDLLWSTWHDIVTLSPAKEGYQSILRIANIIVGYGGKVYLVPGNHDPYDEIIKHAKALPNIIITSEEFALDGFIFLHGHQKRFDRSVNFISNVSKPIEWLLPSLYRKFHGTPSELKETNQYKYDILSAYISTKVYDEARAKKQKIVFGHTHKPIKLESPEGDIALNCGDGQGECTYAIMNKIYMDVEKI